MDVVQSAEPNVRQAVTSYSVSKSFNLPQPYDDLVPTDLGLVHTSFFSFLPACAYFGIIATCHSQKDSTGRHTLG